jgi:hypothetical protein
LFGLEICAEKIHVHGSPEIADAVRGPISCGQQGGTGNGCVAVGLQGSMTPGITAVTLILPLPPARNCTAVGLPPVSCQPIDVLVLGRVVLF